MDKPMTDAERWQLMFRSAEALVEGPLVVVFLVLAFVAIVAAWKGWV